MWSFCNESLSSSSVSTSSTPSKELKAIAVIDPVNVVPDSVSVSLDQFTVPTFNGKSAA